MSKREMRVEKFVYPAVEPANAGPLPEIFEAAQGNETAGGGSEASCEPSGPSGFDCARAREEGFRAGMEQGLREGEARGRAAERARAEAELLAERQERRENAASLTRNFYGAIEKFEHQLENEAVRLALAIAARILRREAQMDPLLLTGAVRVALGQLGDSARVELHVPAADLALWQEAIEHLPNLSRRPVVVGEEAMKLGECRIETEMGSADLGVQPQLMEIERGFFDRARTEEQREAGEVSSAPLQSQAVEGEYWTVEEPMR